MKAKLLIILTFALSLSLMMGGFKESRADISICDNFTVAGFLRYELGVHTAESNPNNPNIGNHDFSLSQTFFQTEWTFKPSEIFKLYAKVRLTGDQTYHIDSELHRYNAFPVDVPQYDWMMMKGSTDDFRAEVWELYSDITLGNLWLRLGKQQIVWGEMIGARILDASNALDRSWNFLFELEEFENIRIPNWSIRGSYNIQQNLLPWVNDLIIEGYVTPGDVVPTIDAEPGAPFRILSFPPFFRIHEKDNRGKMEYGVRMGGMVGQFYGTLNYMHLYNDDFNLKFRGLTPDPIFGVPLLAPRDFTRYAMLLNAEHKSIDLYGMSLNYAFGEPYNLVTTFEGAWIPNQPYGKAGSSLPAIRDQGTWKYAIRFDRPTQVLPPKFLHASFMSIQLQFTQTVVEGDEDRILGGANSKIDKSVETITVQLRQPLWYNNYSVGLQVIYDTDDAYLIKPSLRYVYGNHWYFDLFSVVLGGSEKRPGRIGNLYWADTVYGRVTFQF